MGWDEGKGTSGRKQTNHINTMYNTSRRKLGRACASRILGGGRIKDRGCTNGEEEQEGKTGRLERKDRKEGEGCGIVLFMKQ